jgi:hypothetical protein
MFTEGIKREVEGAERELSGSEVPIKKNLSTRSDCPSYTMYSDVQSFFSASGGEGKLIKNRETPTKGENVRYSIWARRWEHELAGLDLVPVPNEPLPDDVFPAVQRYYDGFIYLLRCRWTDSQHYGAPAPFSMEFAEEWTGLNKFVCRGCRKWLVDNDYMVESGNVGRTKLWLPKTPALVTA